MTKLHQEDQDEPFFITEDVATEMAAADYEFKPPGHARTKSVRDLFGWQFGETLEEAIRRHLGKVDAASECERKGEGA
ncbi:transcriptional regulator [Xylella fastidiosa]|uniref:transcriptional regulator n=1 Tax=Xylella fastidiosa TaxID=2371 RepID=UPI000FFF463F|nr:transcriptional regulator [Xylella fastidiosa]RWA36748.1 transcriptional regulator [Xylella fastidiosa subsp. multiplex]